MTGQFINGAPATSGLKRRNGRMLYGILLGCALLLLHVAVVFKFGVAEHGSLASGLVLLAEGTCCGIACFLASRRSGPLGRYFWRLLTFTF